MKKYDSYKPSGIDWIGEIPSHWDVQRMRYLCDIITGDKDTINRVEDGAYPFYVRSPQIERINSYSFDGEAVLMAGDGVGAGKVLHYANGKFDFHQRVYNIHNFKNIKGKLLFLYLKSLFKYKIEEGGAKNTVDSVRQPWLKDFPVCIPPLEEQEAIASWLDKKCGEIDAAIAKVDREIELIEELKQSEISRVVTRGLNPDVPLRPSGIDWIGEIPEHWKIMPTKYVLDNLDYLRQPISAEDRERKNPQYDYYGASGVIDKIDYYNVEDTVLLIGEDGANLVMRNLPLIYKASGKFWVNNHAHILKPKKNQNYSYLAYLLEAGDYTLYITGSAQPKLSQENLNKFPICVPPLTEQQAIADYLDKKCAEIDGLKAKLTKKRETLKELRQAIISEVVTGKRKVI